MNTTAGRGRAAHDEPWRAALVQAVQANCHVADARHAADLTLCIYLLQMREFHRWSCGLPFGATLDRAAVGRWIAEREALWEAVEGDTFAPLPLPDGHHADPFDVDTVNAALAAPGLLYGAGWLDDRRPVFFLADRHADTTRDGMPVTVGGREWARGLAAPVATLGGPEQAPSIVVRRESLARWCWERFEAYSLKRLPTGAPPDGPEGSAIQAVVHAYALDVDFDAALPRWLEEQTEAAVLHELGEARAGRRLGSAWRALRADLPTRRGDLHARALRDHLADLTVTLPTLLARGTEASIHVWFANLEGVRAVLAPGLAAAYRHWRRGGAAALGEAVTAARLHFEGVAAVALERHARDGKAGGAGIEAWLQSPEAVWPG